MKTVPASPIHERFWLQAQLDASNSAYNVAVVHDLVGLVDLVALQGALDTVVARHEICRSTFHDTPDGLSVSVHDTMEVPLTHQRVDPEDFDAERDTFIARTHLAPVDLSTGPVLWAGVLSAGPDRHLLVTVVHHVALDGASIPVLFGQLQAAYDALVAETELPDLAASRLVAPSVASDEAAITYWRDTCTKMSPYTALPTVGSGVGELAHGVLVELPAPLEAELRRLADGLEASFFEVMAACWAAFIHRYSGEERVAFGYPVSLRPSDGADRLGCYVNTLPLGLEVAGASLEELVARVSTARQEARPHQTLSWERILEVLRDAGHLEGHQSFLNIGFAATHLRHVPMSLSGLEVSPAVPPQVRAIWELFLEYEVGTPTRMRLTGREDRFPPWLVETLMASMLTLIREAVRAPGVPVGELPLVDSAHRARLHVHGQGRDLAPQSSGTLASRFAEVAAERPDAVAVQTGVDGITYWGLDVRSNRMGHALLALLSEAPVVGDRVGVLFERSAEAVTAMLTAVKLGLTYVPLRPSDPVSRWQALLERSGAVAVLGESHLVEQLPEALDILRFSPDVPGSLSGQSDSPLEAATTPDTAAYLMYTSGSTGVPKGVLVPHRAVLRLACGGGAHMLEPDDMVVHGSSLAFDLSTWEIWGSLLTGAAMLVLSKADVLDPTRLAQHLDTHAVTALGLTTPLFHAHADTHPQSFAKLRLLLAGGDVMGPEQVAKILAQPHGRPDLILNGYGPTENTVFSTVARIQDAQAGEALSIGRPIAGSTCFVIDASGALVPVGFSGELWVGGAGVALGYHDADEETSARFVPVPSLDPSGGLLYRTGDRVRWRTDGKLDFLGRMDEQVKIRGQRLEPGEATARVLQHPDVGQAIVVATPGPEPELVLAYTLEPRSKLTDVELHQHLATTLPHHAIPTRRVRVGTLPLTPNGKIDTPAILALAPPPPSTNRVVAPAETATEAVLLALWSTHLDSADLGVLDRFVDVGGDSLRAVRLVAAIRDETGSQLAVGDIYRHGTIRALAVALDGPPRTATVLPFTPPAATNPTPRPRTVPLGLAQMGHWHLLRRGKHYTCPCVLHMQAPMDAEVLLEAWDDVLARHELPWMQLDLEEPVMHRTDPRMCHVIRMDLTRLTPEAAEYQVLSRIRRAAQEPFRNSAPMFRTILAQAASDSWFFGFTTSHALVDGHTLQLFARELHDTYLARLDGRSVTQQPPMSLQGYIDWEASRVTEESVAESVAFYEEHLDGDASWTVPTTHLETHLHGESIRLDPDAIEQLHALAKTQGTSLEATLTYCVFLTLHAIHRAPLVRCLSAYHNRDEPELERLPLMMAGAMYHQSQLDRARSFTEGVAAFGERYVATFSHARLPAMVLFGMSRQLFMRGALRHYLLSRAVATIWSRFSATPRVILTYTVDLVVSSLRYALERRLTRWFRRARTRTVGCFVSVTSSLGEHVPLGSLRLPVRMVHAPMDVPEAIPGDPLMDLHRDAEGVKALFQARYKPAAVRAFVDAYDTVVRHVAASPDAPLGAVMEALASHTAAFEHAKDDED